VISWFQRLLFKRSLYRYDAAEFVEDTALLEPLFD
jgi:hypothetical protein